MAQYEISDEFIEKLKKEASKEDPYLDDDDFVADDYAGGNVDDAYQAGREHADVSSARDLLKELKII